MYWRDRSPLDIETIFKTTTQEIRQLLQADRVAIFSFNDDWSAGESNGAARIAGCNH
ncbi:GAF domain-containing protein [Nostoc commune]|uniref:GAF domain-containing protein n=1 Tax=Nostoc commune TaxID=1178 RepID=UPI000D59D4CD|nr:GAF domain-containing protein [Nostoc commune]